MRAVRSLDQLPHGAAVAEAMAQAPAAVEGAVAYRTADGQDKVRLYGPGCKHRRLEDAIKGLPRGLIVWARGLAPDSSVQAGSRTATAIRLLDSDATLSPHAAARLAGVHVSAVYRAMRRATHPRCAHCGQRLPT